jgi:hypothetical protein
MVLVNVGLRPRALGVMLVSIDRFVVRGRVYGNNLNRARGRIFMSHVGSRSVRSRKVRSRSMGSRGMGMRSRSMGMRSRSLGMRSRSLGMRSRSLGMRSRSLSLRSRGWGSGLLSSGSLCLRILGIRRCGLSWFGIHSTVVLSGNFCIVTRRIESLLTSGVPASGIWVRGAHLVVALRGRVL